MNKFMNDIQLKLLLFCCVNINLIFNLLWSHSLLIYLFVEIIKHNNLFIKIIKKRKNKCKDSSNKECNNSSSIKKI